MDNINNLIDGNENLIIQSTPPRNFAPLIVIGIVFTLFGTVFSSVFFITIKEFDPAMIAFPIVGFVFAAIGVINLIASARIIKSTKKTRLVLTDKNVIVYSKDTDSYDKIAINEIQSWSHHNSNVQINNVPFYNAKFTFNTALKSYVATNVGNFHDIYTELFKLVPNCQNPIQSFNSISSYVYSRLASLEAKVAQQQANPEQPQPKPQEEFKYQVALERVGPDRLLIIKTLREKTAASLATAMKFLEATPCIIYSTNSERSADILVQELESLGCEAYKLS